MVAAATTTRKDVAETSTETSTDDLHVFGMRAAEQLVQSFATIAHAQGRFSEELFSDSSEQKLFPTDKSTLDTTHSGEGNVVAEEQDGTAGTSTLEINVTQNEDQPDEDAVAEDQLEEGNVVAADQNDTEGTNTLEVDITQNKDQPDEDAVTEDQAGDDTQQYAGNNEETGDDTQQDAGNNEDQNDTTMEGPSNAGTSTIEVEVAHNEDETDENTTTGDTTSGDTTVSDPGKSTAHNTEHTVVVGRDHSNGVRVHKKTITIVVHSNMKGVVEKVSKNFRDYQKKVKLPGIDLKLHPVVTLPHVKADNPAKPHKPEKEVAVVTTSLVPSVVHSENSTQMVEMIRLTDSVNQDTGVPKRKVKVYLDEDLLLEQFLIQKVRNPSPTKGKELSKYFRHLFLQRLHHLNCFPTFKTCEYLSCIRLQFLTKLSQPHVCCITYVIIIILPQVTA